MTKRVELKSGELAFVPPRSQGLPGGNLHDFDAPLPVSQGHDPAIARPAYAAGLEVNLPPQQEFA